MDNTPASQIPDQCLEAANEVVSPESSEWGRQNDKKFNNQVSTLPTQLNDLQPNPHQVSAEHEEAYGASSASRRKHGNRPPSNVEKCDDRGPSIGRYQQGKDPNDAQKAHRSRKKFLAIAASALFILVTLVCSVERKDKGVYDKSSTFLQKNSGPLDSDVKSKETPNAKRSAKRQKFQNASLQVGLEFTAISKRVKEQHRLWSKELHQITGLDKCDDLPMPKIHWDWHPGKRSERFPSVEDRIQYYMGKWFNTAMPLHGNDFRQKTYVYQKTTRQYNISTTTPVNLFGLSSDAFISCHDELQKSSRLQSAYCRDSVDLAILRSEGTTNVMQHFGDAVPEYQTEADKLYPLFNKVRHFCREDPNTNKFSNSICNEDHVDTIVWPLNRHRHFGPVCHIVPNDIPWEKKKPCALWRGAPPTNLKWTPDHGTNNDKRNPTMDMKWRLVSSYSKSALVDAKYTVRAAQKTQDFILDEHLADFSEFDEQLGYKYLISIEGNDVSSGLKWMLFSNSLVFMPPVTYESWAMEGLLEPFVHYIPINANMSNLEERVKWAEANPREAQKIAERATLFIYDLLLHPDALAEEEQILQGIMERYELNFGFAATVAKLHPLSHVHTEWHPKNRIDRFPTVEQRTKYYMGQWHSKRTVSMNRKSFHHPRLLEDGSRKPVLHKEVLAGGKLLSQCASGGGEYSDEVRQYCVDALPDFDERHAPSLRNQYGRRQKLQSRGQPRALDDSIKIVRFGDGTTEWTDLPVFSKSRAATKTPGRDGSSILWEFDYAHEFNLVRSGVVEQNDRPFGEKDPRALWRGGIGSKGDAVASSEFMSRYKMVRFSLNTSAKRVDAKFVISEEKRSILKSGRNALSREIIDAELDGAGELERLKLALSFRYIVASEDDFRINSDIKWMLLSQSVVLMPEKLRFTSWFMEELLEPYVHYVPIAADYRDVAKQVQWCEENRAEAQRISERATLYVHDLLFHSYSDGDNSEVKFRIMERYARRFDRDSGELKEAM